MNNLHCFALLSAIIVLDVQATSHHGGHAGKPAMGGAACLRPTISKMQPPHLSTVTAGSTFSFVLSNVDDTSQVSVEVKKQPVKIDSVFKDPYYVVSGKIPADLSNTAARVDVKIDSKVPSCRAEEGWLLKIAGK
jgi:hypothetical protein